MAEFDFTDMLQQITEEIPWKIALHEDSRTIYRQNNRGYFEELSLTSCKMEVRKVFKLATPATIGNLVNALLEDDARIFDDALFLESRRRVVGFLNGVFDLQTGEVREYSTTDFILGPLPHRIPHQVPADTEKYLLDVFAKWVGGLECADWMLDMLAYLLFTFPNEEQIWVNFFGVGSNGKGVCLELLERILGDGKCVGCDLAHINRFSGDTFQGKWLVVGRDSSQYVSDTATSFIKTYSGDPKLLVEEKGGASYDVYNPGKLIVSTNSLIQSKDRTYSWYRRLVPIPFPNTFSRDEKFKAKFFQQVPQMIRVLLHRAYLYKQNAIPIMNHVPENVRRLMQETRYLNDRITAFWELEFFKDVTHLGSKDRVIDSEKLRFLDGKSMSEVYAFFALWSEGEFGEGNVEPSLKTFGGPYGAFLQSDAGKYFHYKRTGAARTLELLPESAWPKGGKP